MSGQKNSDVGSDAIAVPTKKISFDVDVAISTLYQIGRAGELS